MVDWLTGEQAVQAMRPYETQLAIALENAEDGQTLVDVQQQLYDKQAQLWLTHMAAVVTKVVDDWLVIWLVGGKIDRLPGLLPHIEQWGAGIGCKGTMVYGRPGWERTFLRAAGFQHKWSIMVRDYEQG